MVYAREIKGEVLTFGHSGKVLRNALVVYDKQTGSLWSQFVGEAVSGPYAETPLELLPSMITTWAAWKLAHPDTLALKQDVMPAFDTYQFYYANSDAGVTGETVNDDRLPTKEFVVGFANGEAIMAYPYSTLNEEPVINDTVGHVDLVVGFDAISGTASVFNRSVEGQLLTFSLSGVQDDGYATMQDSQTKSTWHALSGKAISGQLEGAGLDQLPGHLAYWFAWKDHYPTTKVYGE